MNAAAVDMLVGGLLCAAVRAPLVLSARNTRTLITVFTRTSWGPLASGGQDVVTPAQSPAVESLHFKLGASHRLIDWNMNSFMLVPCRPGLRTQGTAGSQAANKTK